MDAQFDGTDAAGTSGLREEQGEARRIAIEDLESRPPAEFGDQRHERANVCSREAGRRPDELIVDHERVAHLQGLSCRSNEPSFQAPAARRPGEHGLKPPRRPVVPLIRHGG